MLALFHEQAEFLRESSGSSNIEATLRKALKVVAAARIPHYVCGGFAVQEHGYPRFTQDADLIVPDVGLAYETLCLNGFWENTRVRTNLLPAGQKLDLRPLRLPVPTLVSDEP